MATDGAKREKGAQVGGGQTEGARDPAKDDANGWPGSERGTRVQMEQISGWGGGQSNGRGNGTTDVVSGLDGMSSRMIGTGILMGPHAPIQPLEEEERDTKNHASYIIKENQLD